MYASEKISSAYSHGKYIFSGRWSSLNEQIDTVADKDSCVESVQPRMCSRSSRQAYAIAGL